MAPQVIIPICFALLVFLGWSIGTYNKFVKYRNRIEEAWSGIDVALKRRANLIPNLVRVIEGYSSHEGRIFEEKMRRQDSAANSSRLEQESEISKSIGGLLALLRPIPT